MSKRSDTNYLLKSQYHDATNLQARIALHTRFKTNPYDWFRFVFDHLSLPGDAAVLELGCGPGNLWLKNLERIPPRWTITLSDFSPGMVSEAKINLSETNRNFLFTIINAQHIPLEDEQLDAVIANHMLYHIPDRKKALSEIHRVLSPKGFLFAATNGENHLSELRYFYDYLQVGMVQTIDHTFSANEFTLDNGSQQLAPWFQTNIIHYHDALEVTETEPLIAYLLSMTPRDNYQISADKIINLRSIIDDQIQDRGSIHITKSTGLFICRKRDS